MKMKMFLKSSLFFLLLFTMNSRMLAQKINTPLKIIEEQFALWQQGKATIFDLLDDNVIWEVAGSSPVSGIYHGKNEFLKEAVQPINARFKSAIKPELISIHADGNWVYMNWKGSALTINNTMYRNTYCWKMKIIDGKIVEAVAFLDTYALNELMKQ